MASDLLRELLQAALASSVAIVLLQLLRRPLRARFGARVAYRAWLLVPVAMLAVWLPAASAPPAMAQAALRVGAVVFPAGVSADASLALPAATLLLWAWGLGSGLLLFAFALRQRRFTRLLARRRGRVFDSVEDQGPAVVGWWRSRIVLPADFRERYDRSERRLVLAHEIVHLRSGDIHAQAVATGLRCLFWFNPLVHFAAAQFRFDQELACDASVLEQFPRARGCYGRAMLKTQLAGFGLPVGCHWQSSHPLKERIEMLKHPAPARARKRLGSLAVATLLVGASYAAWATQPQAPKSAKPVTAPSTAPYLTSIEQGDSLPPPVYPAGVTAEGKVEIELLVGADGKVKDVKVIKSEPQGVFDQATIEAARQWRVRPAMENGVPIEGRVRTQVEFTRHGDPAAAKKG